MKSTLNQQEYKGQIALPYMIIIGLAHMGRNGSNVLHLHDILWAARPWGVDGWGYGLPFKALVTKQA